MFWRIVRLVAMAALIVPAAACSSATATPAPATGPAVLQIGIMVHLEGWHDDTDKGRFAEHALLIRDYAALFEKHGAKLTWASKEVTEGIIRWGDNVLLEMQQRGHGVGVHADIGGEKSYDCARFAGDLRAEKVQLESLGLTVRHVSGIVSTCDWVTAAADAGFLFTTGNVAYSVMSMPVEKRPAEYRDCKSPSACHDTFPTELADRINPWRAEDGTNWLTDNRKGHLVILPASGGIALMGEEASGAAMKGNEAPYDQADLDAFFSQLDAALALARPDRVNTYYVSWSLGSTLDQAVLEKWLAQLESYVKSGRAKWSTLPEMYDSYVAWEKGR
jgi:hypothetical protein